MKSGHQYQVMLVPIPAEQTDAESRVRQALVFNHRNHDDLFQIVERTRKGSGLDADSAAAMALGLKLLGSVMLEQKDNPLFDCLRKPMREFIGELKALSVQPDAQTAAE